MWKECFPPRISWLCLWTSATATHGLCSSAWKSHANFCQLLWRQRSTGWFCYVFVYLVRPSYPPCVLKFDMLCFEKQPVLPRESEFSDTLICAVAGLGSSPRALCRTGRHCTTVVCPKFWSLNFLDVYITNGRYSVVTCLLSTINFIWNMKTNNCNYCDIFCTLFISLINIYGVQH